MSLFNNYLWYVTSFIIILCGLYFSINLKFPQFQWKKIFKSIFSKSSSKAKTIDSLLMSLSSRIGIGSIAGIALAIKFGGIGSIFWIWIITLIVSSISYLESYYGAHYKTMIKEDNYIGGPHHYIKKALGKPKLSLLYALILIICYSFGFTSIQANTVSVVTQISTNLSPHLINITIILLFLIILSTDTVEKNKIISKMVPSMIILYLLLGLIIILKNPIYILSIFKEIFFSAFKIKAFSGGLIYTIIVGMQRGIFATEVAIGTSAVSAAMASSSPQSQGYLQILGNYITVFVICTVTALIILSSNYNLYVASTSNGIELALHAFEYHFNQFGRLFIIIFIILFAFSTIISGVYFGESTLEFITNRPIIKKFYKAIVIIFIFLSMYINASKLWTLIDILVAFLCLINLYSIIKIYKKSHK